MVLVTVGLEMTGPERWAVISVADHGIGIPAADLPFLGEFVRRGANVGTIAGTGHGLVGVRQIVTEHGGTLTGSNHTDVNEDESTTTLTVRLPLGD